MTKQQKLAVQVFLRQASAGLREAKKEKDKGNYIIADYDLQNVIASCEAAMREMKEYTAAQTEAVDKLSASGRTNIGEAMNLSKQRIMEQAEHEEL